MDGYIRSDKKLGIRNHILIMSAADNVNPLSSPRQNDHSFFDRTAIKTAA